MHYILSDIHGNKEAFDTMLSLIDLQPEDHLYILGDVIDRGVHGIELLLQIREMQNCTLLIGNHEYMMVNAFRHPDNLHLKYIWRNNGYMHTYDHFVSLTQKEQEDLLRYLESLPLQLEITVNRRRYILVHAAPKELLETENERCYEPNEFMGGTVCLSFPVCLQEKMLYWVILRHGNTIKSRIFFTAGKCLLSIAVVVSLIAAVSLDVSGWRI